MQVKKQQTPGHVQSALTGLLPHVVEYLDLEENSHFSRDGLALAGYFSADSKFGFLVFEYLAEEGPAIAFVQHALTGERIEDGCIGCWPRTEGQTIEWSLGEFLEYNPL